MRLGNVGFMQVGEVPGGFLGYSRSGSFAPGIKDYEKGPENFHIAQTTTGIYFVRRVEDTSSLFVLGGDSNDRIVLPQIIGPSPNLRGRAVYQALAGEGFGTAVVVPQRGRLGDLSFVVPSYFNTEIRTTDVVEPSERERIIERFFGESLDPEKPGLTGFFHSTPDTPNLIQNSAVYYYQPGALAGGGVASLPEMVVTCVIEGVATAQRTMYPHYEVWIRGPGETKWQPLVASLDYFVNYGREDDVVSLGDPGVSLLQIYPRNPYSNVARRVQGYQPARLLSDQEKVRMGIVKVRANDPN